MDANHRGAELMVELVTGREAALGEIIELWRAPLLRFVYRYVQIEADAHDLVQETFVRLHAQRARFRPGAAFSAWIFTIAANLCHNQARWKKRHPTDPLETLAKTGNRPSLAGLQPSPDHALLKAERVQAVRTAIAGLPHDLKVTLLLHEYEDLGYREIAAVVGCSEKGVEARLARARARLREALASFLADGQKPRMPVIPTAFGLVPRP